TQNGRRASNTRHSATPVIIAPAACELGKLKLVTSASRSAVGGRGLATAILASSTTIRPAAITAKNHSARAERRRMSSHAQGSQRQAAKAPGLTPPAPPASARRKPQPNTALPPPR